MKKKIIFCVLGAVLLAALIFLIVWFSITADNNTPTDGTTNSPTTSDTTETTKDIQLNTSMVSISLPILEETDIAGDETVIFRRTYQDVVLSIPNADIAQAVTLNLLQRMDVNSATVSNVQASAYVDYTGQEYWQSYYYKILYSAKRVDETVLSLYGIEDVYSPLQGGYSGISVNYNLLTGSVLTLQSILTEESNATNRLLEELLAALDSIKTEAALFSDYQDIVTGRFPTDLQQESGWYFSDKGLCFFFAPYDIAPNASGIVVATVPYDKLLGIVQDAYFPVEQPDFPGQLSVAVFDETDFNKFSTYPELIADADASRYLLSTEGVLYDLKVEQGHWTTPGTFRPVTTIFYANRLSPAEAFVLRASLGKQATPLRISYRCDGEEYFFILDLTEDNTPVLTPTNK